MWSQKVFPLDSWFLLLLLNYMTVALFVSSLSEIAQNTGKGRKSRDRCTADRLHFPPSPTDSSMQRLLLKPLSVGLARGFHRGMPGLRQPHPAQLAARFGSAFPDLWSWISNFLLPIYWISGTADLIGNAPSSRSAGGNKPGDRSGETHWLTDGLNICVLKRRKSPLLIISELDFDLFFLGIPRVVKKVLRNSLTNTHCAIPRGKKTFEFSKTQNIFRTAFTKVNSLII